MLDVARQTPVHTKHRVDPNTVGLTHLSSMASPISPPELISHRKNQQMRGDAGDDELRGASPSD